MSLLMLSYNIKRVLNILGLETFRAYCLLRAKNRPRETKKSYLEHVQDVFFAISRFTAQLSNKMASGHIHLRLNGASVVFF